MPHSTTPSPFDETTYAALPDVLFERCLPVPVSRPECLVWNQALGQELGLEPWAGDAGIWSGNCLPEGAKSLAQAYAGHQFGHFTMLGDGRAHLLGEQVRADGTRVDLQLKGSGRTVFSRGGDGRAALEPMLREYLISEAMHALGIPTTRSLAVVRTGETVRREGPLPGAVLTRVAASHLRVGTFQYAAGCGEPGVLPALVQFAIARHCPHVAQFDCPALGLLRWVVEAQAELLAKWMLAGFVHGVMNTDNMAISGETIDYGPCAFLDAYDPATVFSSIDRQGRYAYGNQPSMALWNLSRFAETLLPELNPVDEKAVGIAEDALNLFEGHFRRTWMQGMRAKLGLFTEEEEDEGLIADLLAAMQQHHADYTLSFLSLDPDAPERCLDPAWHAAWVLRLRRESRDPEAVRRRMREATPQVIPRNHAVEEALNAAGAGDMKPFEVLLAVLRDPFRLDEFPEKFRKGPPAGHPPYITFCGT